MVSDNIKNASQYYGLGTRIETALKWLQDKDLSQLQPGKVEVDGEEIFAIVNHYDTRKIEDSSWEAHRRYIDIQFIVSGSEMMGYVPLDTLTATTNFDESKDVCLYEGAGTFIDATPGTFFILFPQDAHMPNILSGSSEPVKKVIMKVLV